MNNALFILDCILSFVSSYFLIAATIVFLHCFYDPGFLWNKKKAVLLVPYILVHLVLSCLSYSALAMTILSLFNLIVGTWVVVYDYRGKQWQGIFRYLWVYSLISFCTVIISEIGIQYIFPGHDWLVGELSQGNSLIVNILYILIFSIIFFYLYFRIYKKDIVFPWTKRERIFVAIYSIFCIAFLIVIQRPNANHDTSIRIMGSCFVLTTVLVPVFFYYLRISEYFQKRARHQEDYMQAELNYFQQYKRNQEETARFRHDVKNNLLCLNDLLGAGKSQEATEYLQSLLQITETLRPKYISGDEILDSILAAKSQDMEHHGIAFTLDGVLAGGLGWKPVDICSVFANALDNAIEACIHLSDIPKEITMEIKSTAQFWMVRLTNPTLENVDTEKLFKRVGGYTSKASGLHGIGTYNMKRTVESYGGMISARCEDQRFVLEVMIDKSK